MSEVIVLYDGFSNMTKEDEMIANCSCTIIKGEHNVIVDTMTAWDKEKILAGLQKHNLTPDEIHYLVSTHGHSDHIGNNNLFVKAKHIVGYSISFKEKYFLHPFDKGEEYKINHSVYVIPTPGHTLSDVTVIVTTVEGQRVAVTGDLFEKFEDIENPSIWLEAGSEDQLQQSKNRLKVAELADWIVPGHGSKFQVTESARATLRRQAENSQIKLKIKHLNVFQSNLLHILMKRLLHNLKLTDNVGTGWFNIFYRKMVSKYSQQQMYRCSKK